MPDLLELQRRFAAALASPVGTDALAADVAAGRVPFQRQLAVHRNTVWGALDRALRLRYPAVARLGGADFFDAAVRAYAADDWPAAPQLGAWGAAFATFLERFAPAATLPWLPELARFEALLDAQTTLGDAGPAQRWPATPLGAGAHLALAPSLRVFAARYPVDALREAALAVAAPAEVKCANAPAALQLAVWRDGAAVRSRRISAAAAGFLDRLRASAPATAALAAAMAATGLDAAAVVTALQHEIFTAPFATLRASAAPIT